MNPPARIEVIKLASPEENPALARQIATLAFRELGDVARPSSEDMDALVQDMRGRTTVAALGAERELLGAGSLYRYGRPNQNQAAILDLAVEPDSRNRGIGRIIVAELEKEAANVGIDTLIAYTLPGSEGFYQKIGFHQVEGEEGSSLYAKQLKS